MGGICIKLGALQRGGTFVRCHFSAQPACWGGRATLVTRPRTTIVPSVSRRNALVCSHDHLTLFLTLVSGLEFIRFDLDLVRHHGSWWQRVGRSEVLLREPIVCD